ncbi:MAG: leucyl aminopeptidase [Planctomycetes bacterium]|nr:leucyl aminopeptidase [Planctomycetota bacterium]
MKPQRKIKVTTRRADAVTQRTDMLVVGAFSHRKTIAPALRPLDQALAGALLQLYKIGDFTGDGDTQSTLYTNGAIPAKRILLCGLGDRSKVTLTTLRKCAAAAAGKAVSLGVSSISVALHMAMPKSLDRSEVGRVIAEGICHGAYRYEEYMTAEKKAESPFVATLVEADATVSRALAGGVRRGTTIGLAGNFARTIANRPGNVITPKELAKVARGVARSSPRLSCRVMDPKQLVTLGMGGILAVGTGSVHPPRLIVLRHTAKGKSAKSKPTIALVGKAVTFDAGGISIKPAEHMDQMKFDKSGGVAVIATLKAIAELGLDLNVVGIVPSAENLPSGSAYRPGDIVTTYSGKTVEIINTDAEGRMILADGIAYANTLKCDIIVDIATLTGACLVALGQHQAGLMSDDDDLLKALKHAADQSGEPVWHLPSGEEYARDMKSKVADLKNAGATRWGGASTAAAFLRQFADQTPWAHLDIAGMDVFNNGSETATPGSSGFGVRLLCAFLTHMSQR